MRLFFEKDVQSNTQTGQFSKFCCYFCRLVPIPYIYYLIGKGREKFLKIFYDDRRS